MQGSDRDFYGTTAQGGEFSSGTLFRISPSGNLMTLYSFIGGDGATPCAGLVQGSDGNFYGTTYDGGTGGYGTVFKFRPITCISASSSPSEAGTISGGGTVLCGSNVTVCAAANLCYRFVNWTENGNVVGTAACYAFTASSNRTLVANFAPVTYTITTSSSPASGGSTSGGGTVSCGSGVSLNATTNACYHFVNWTENGIEVSTSASYSFTAGTNRTLVAHFAGLGPMTMLYSFSGSDGAAPYAGLVQGTDGNFYGTTCQGGTSGYGTVFRISPSGWLMDLHRFTGGSDGLNPYGLVQGSGGYFYGTTFQGGADDYGTVFRIGSDGTFTNLYSFSWSDGTHPQAELVRSGDGNFYGTTYFGGIGYGTVFRIGSDGTFTNLHSFGSSDGAYPEAGLVQGTDGNFYGTTSVGGPSGYGTLFRISPAGTLTTLHSFSGSDGTYPRAGLVQGSDGSFYGTTYQGGCTATAPCLGSVGTAPSRTCTRSEGVMGPIHTPA